jgi:hypothetical protein
VVGTLGGRVDHYGLLGLRLFVSWMFYRFVERKPRFATLATVWWLLKLFWEQNRTGQREVKKKSCSLRKAKAKIVTVNMQWNHLHPQTPFVHSSSANSWLKLLWCSNWAYMNREMTKLFCLIHGLVKNSAEHYATSYMLALFIHLPMPWPWR